VRAGFPAALLRALVGAAALWLCAAASAQQLGGSIELMSDYRFRGVSLSRERPGARLSLSLDDASGAYAGLSLTSIELQPGQRQAGLQGYAGFARALNDALRWEAGGSYSHAVQASPGVDRYNHGEAFAGLLAPSWSLRLYFSPEYFGWRERTLYAELDAHTPLLPSLELIGHLGLLQQLGRDDARRVDSRLGVVLHTETGLAWQLAWLATGKSGPFPAPYDQRRSLVWLGASYSF